MKSKFSIPLITVLVLIAVYFMVPNSTKNQLDTAPKLAMNIIKCTPANFLLENVDTTTQISPLFDNLGEYSFTISTNQKKAQLFFNQGLKLTFAFNHAESHRSFMEASRLDPNSAMSFWGQAYALGPNINDSFPDDDRKKKSFEAMQRAKSLLSNTSPIEQDLIEALLHRYSEEIDADVGSLNSAYMDAMAKVIEKYPNNPDVLTLYAAAVMNTVPWNYWDNEGNPSPNIKEAKAALEKAIKIDPNHPGAHHYYIHMVELPKPDLAVSSAEKLGTLMPGAGHLVHMPSHIYIRVGRYKDAVLANQKAILADEDYISQCYSQGMYPLGYYPHNIHFLWSASSLLGDSRVAIDAAKKTAEKVPLGEMTTLPFLQDFASTPLLSYIRFGKWNDILTTPYPGDDYQHLKLIWHYARSIAFIRKNNLKEAREEVDAIAEMTNDENLENTVVTSDNSTRTLAKIAYGIAAGEFAASTGEMDAAIEHLKKAVSIEDKLTYTEPSSWHIPTRQTLGALLLKSQKYEAAELIYKEDLAILRQNGWSLIGLYHSLKAQGKTKEASKIKQEFDKAWAHADVQINSSVL
jgi:tetratricopeptide (TPR) repeat protein